MEYQPGAPVNDEITLKRRLGAGAMGEVWVGEHRGFRREVAVKFVSARHATADENADRRFENEGRANARVRSPHVVQTYDFGRTEDGTAYLVMELLRGETLGDLLRRTPVADPRMVADVVDQVARGLEGAHLRNIVHRDIKPDNVFLVATGNPQRPFVKLLDFGTAHNLDDFVNQRLTQPGMILGTPAYISRDMVIDPGEVSPFVDLWAIGVMAYRALTGQLPYLGEGIANVCQAIVNGEWTRPSEVRSHLPVELDRFFETVFHDDRSRRPHDAFELANGLRRALGLPAFVEVEPPANDGARERRLRSETPPPLRSVALRPDMADPGTIDAFPTPALDAGVPRRPRKKKRLPFATIAVAALVLALCAIAAVWWVRRHPAAAQDEESSPEPSTIVPSAESKTASNSAVAATPPPAPSSSSYPSPTGRVRISGGRVQIGCDPGKDKRCDQSELPQHLMTLDAFDIDRTEVTVQSYANCVRAKVCSARRVRSETVEGHPSKSDKCNWGRRGRRDYPINCVSAAEAKAYCAYRHGRLPTEAEWEHAAKGSPAAPFPWGNQPPSCRLSVIDVGEAACRPKGTEPVGRRPAGLSATGLFDMGGNVSEWTSDPHRENYLVELTAANKSRVTVRGGSWRSSSPTAVRLVRRAGQPVKSRSASRGFRCVYDVTK